MLATIGFDADDTLWHNETVFRLTQERFRDLLAEHADAETVEARLLEVERRNLDFFGYGVKGFALSLIETAHEIAGDALSPRVVPEIISAAREMLVHPVETLEGAEDVLRALHGRVRLVLITKGDLFDQERKLAQSGLGELFDAVEIVSEKTDATYARAFAAGGPARAMMVGNSLRSDVLPALAAGAWGVHVPYHVTWALEEAEAPVDHPRFRRIESLADLPALIDSILETA